jgi:cytochrome c oxidase subunit 5b
MECGSTYKMHYVGPQEDAHGHDHGHHAGTSCTTACTTCTTAANNVTENPYPRPKNMADFLKPEYMHI